MLAPTLLCLGALTAGAQVLQYGDRAPDGRFSVGDPGPLILFDTGQEGQWLNRVEMNIATTGGLQAETECSLYVVDLDGRLLRRIQLPYSVLSPGQDGWVALPIAPVEVPLTFGIGLVGAPEAVQWLEAELSFEWRGRRQSALTVGFFSVDRSHSYRWSPGQPGEGLWDKDWMVRAYVSNTPDGDPDATDLVVLNSGEVFLDRVLSAGGEALEVRTASHGAIPQEEVAALRLGAVTSPALATARIWLVDGRVLEGTVEAMDEAMLTLRQGEATRLSLSRTQVARIAFTTAMPVPIGPQVQPPVSDTRRAWGTEQLIGPPDTPTAGDQRTAWASATQDGGDEWLLLTYETEVEVAEVRVRETYNPGAVSKVVAIADDNTEVVLWEGEDPTREAPSDFVATPQVQARARQIRVTLDSDRVRGWNEIDAVELVGKDGTRQWVKAATASSCYADR